MSKPLSADPRPFSTSIALRALAALYGWAVVARAVLYDRGWLSRRRLPRRVISVGNLTAGGTGKTPIVIWIVEQLLAAGWRVAVLSRGYRRRSTASRLLVSDGRQMLVDPADAGDEPYLIARRCPTAIVAVGAERYGLGRWVLAQQPVDCYVLDDGFQHLGVCRDLDLLLIDASDPVGLNALLPAGRLREPLRMAGRADEVLITRAESDEDVDRVWGLLKPHRTHKSGAEVPIRVNFRADKLVGVGTAAVRQPEEAAGRTAVIFSGIGNAGSFRRLLERLGLKIVQEFIFSDHYVYSRADLVRIQTAGRQHAADLIVTTEKDAVKLPTIMGPLEQIWAVRLACDVIEGHARLEQLILGSKSATGL